MHSLMQLENELFVLIDLYLSRRRLYMKVFFNSSPECVMVTIDNRFCLQTSKYFSLEFSEEVIRS